MREREVGFVGQNVPSPRIHEGFFFFPSSFDKQPTLHYSWLQRLCLRPITYFNSQCLSPGCLVSCFFGVFFLCSAFISKPFALPADAAVRVERATSVSCLNFCQTADEWGIKNRQKKKKKHRAGFIAHLRNNVWERVKYLVALMKVIQYVS